MHECKFCGLTFRISKRLFEHQLKKHKGMKISNMLEQLAEIERYYSSDSECEYTVNIEVVKTIKTREQHQQALEEAQALDALFLTKRDTKSSDESDTEQFEAASDQEVAIRHECPYCPKNFSYEYSVREHVKFYHVIESGVLDIDPYRLTTFDCPVCTLNLKNIRCLRKHLKMVHNLTIKGMEFNDAIKFPIEEYPYLEDGTSKKIRGRDMSTEIKDQKCEICGKICTNYKSLKQHLKLYHAKESGVISLDLANMTEFFW